MRYVKPFTTNVALLDLPRTKNDHSDEGEKRATDRRDKKLTEMFKYLLVYDQEVDHDYSSVLDEAIATLGNADPGLGTSFGTVFRQFMENPSHVAKWEKIKQDYGFYIQSEAKRRNRENPYHPARADQVESWEELPDFTKQKRNQPWQFDYMYRDAQFLIGELYELTRNFQTEGDNDLFRIKVNGILVPDKLIFALNSGDAFYDFGDLAIRVVNCKLSLDGYKLAHVFLNRTIESMRKLARGSSAHGNFEPQISSAELLKKKIETRIEEIERRFTLFMGALYDEG
jgi:hypothetical protein